MDSFTTQIMSLHESPDAGLPSAQKLMEVIRTQTEIARNDLDLAGVMELIAARAQTLTGASGAVVEMAEANEMVYTAAVGAASGQIGLRIPRQGSLSGLAMSGNSVLRCDDSEIDDRVDRSACRRVGLRSMIVVPLIHRNVQVGVLKVVSPQVSAFADDDSQILTLLSEVIAAAMFQQARLESNDLYHRATHDSLTGLANRALFFDRLRQKLASAKRYSELVGIISLDMDGLKPINDQYGHRVGDLMLREFASRLQGACRASDTVARLGGDEFSVILSGLESADAVSLYARRISSHIEAPFNMDEHSIPVRASIGTAVYPDDATEVDKLLDVADQAMYAAKRLRSQHVTRQAFM